MRFSVVTISYDQPEIAAVHVREIMRASVVPDEIIVVNDHGAVGLLDMLRKLKCNTKIIYAYITNDIPWNYTGARNLGVWLSSGDYLSIEDTDNIPSVDAYRDAFNLFRDTKHSGRILYGRRPKIMKKDLLSMPIEDCPYTATRPRHDDTHMIPRDVYLKVKGCDERFAGEYAWACAGWRRRLERAGFETICVKTPFYAVYDGETYTLKRSKSYRNYHIARQYLKPEQYDVLTENEKKGYVEIETKKRGKQYLYFQSQGGILNFNYQYTVL